MSSFPLSFFEYLVKNRFKIFFGVMFLNFIDVILTIKGLSMGMVELNPIMKLIVYSPIMFISVKIFVVFLICFIFYMSEEIQPNFKTDIALNFMIFISIIPVINNTILIYGRLT